MTKTEKRAYMRKWLKDHPEARRRYKKNWSAKNPGYDRARYLRRRDIERQRKGLPTPTRSCPTHCECCGAPSLKRALCLDHDHETGEFRGWICQLCNFGIGALGDNIRGLSVAILYLTRTSVKVSPP